MTWTTIPAAGAKLRGSVLSPLITEVRPLGAFKTANETVTSSTTLQNDDELFVSVSASTYYKFTALLLWTSGGTPDFKFALSMPASATARGAIANWSNAGAAGSLLVNSFTLTDTTAVSISGAGTTFSSQGQHTLVHGYILTSVTAGTVYIQWAQNTSDASNTVVYAGSWLQLQQLV